MVAPPSALAPRHTASITPLSPPQTTVAPRRASSRPTPSPRSSSSRLRGRLLPMTAIIIAPLD